MRVIKGLVCTTVQHNGVVQIFGKSSWLDAKYEDFLTNGLVPCADAKQAKNIQARLSYRFLDSPALIQNLTLRIAETKQDLHAFSQVSNLVLLCWASPSPKIPPTYRLLGRYVPNCIREIDCCADYLSNELRGFESLTEALHAYKEYLRQAQSNAKIASLVLKCAKPR